MNKYQILVGDNRETLKSLPNDSVHVCITSPPYFALRKYSGDEAGIQIGAEQSVEEYIANLVSAHSARRWHTGSKSR
jgi:DNA modification methylase